MESAKRFSFIQKVLPHPMGSVGREVEKIVGLAFGSRWGEFLNNDVVVADEIVGSIDDAKCASTEESFDFKAISEQRAFRKGTRLGGHES